MNIPKKRQVKYLLIFEKLMNFHLIKETGMIPYYLHRNFNFNSKILTYQNESNYPYLKVYCEGLKLEFLKKLKRFNNLLYCDLPIVKYLLFNSKKIDILELMHLTNTSVIYCILYKFLNPKGFIYLKTDALEDIKNHNKIRIKSYVNYNYYTNKGLIAQIKNTIRIILGTLIKKLFLKAVNLLSIESKEIYNDIKNYPTIKEKIIYAPSGIDDIHAIKLASNKILFKNKKNMIITVGRLGSTQKATETLLQAVSKIKSLENWQVILIGPIETKFKKWILDYFQSFPYLKKKVFFTGEISDRKKLYEYYQLSKIFCLTSRWESFGLVLVEAGYYGNFIVSTNIPTAREITNYGNFGSLFEIEDSDQLAKILEYLIENEFEIEKNYLIFKKFIEEHFLWKNIVKELYKEIIKQWKF